MRQRKPALGDLELSRGDRKWMETPASPGMKADSLGIETDPEAREGPERLECLGKLLGGESWS